MKNEKGFWHNIKTKIPYIQTDNRFIFYGVMIIPYRKNNGFRGELFLYQDDWIIINETIKGML